MTKARKHRWTRRFGVHGDDRFLGIPAVECSHAELEAIIDSGDFSDVDDADVMKQRIRASLADTLLCGCADVYFCPTAGEIECPRHSGFSVCCNAVSSHVLLPHASVVAQSHARPST